CEIDHILPSGVGGPTHPDNGRPQCRPHHRQHHRASTTPPRPPPETHDDYRLTGAAHLELARARIRDRLLHDPAWGALAADGGP
ncbi:MAG TPA: HNH endonuclease signature motif containing protein, partial [Acidimicrobiales bacterium]|nr:HNH endonuclease signature motif containing protein [Acidimicrobiales bacterium]